MQDEVYSRSYVTMLPMELHLRFRYYVLRDPYTTFEDYKSLRLVCKLFDLVWSPVVLNHIVFFPLGPGWHDDIRAQLRHLERNTNNNLSLANTLTIKDWHNLNTGLYWFVEDVRQAQFSASNNLAPRTVATLVRMMVALASFTIVPAVKLAKVLANPKQIPRRLKATSELHQARRFANQFPNKLSFPNVHCARLIFRALEGNWVVQHTTKILRALPQLTELELLLPAYSNMSYIARCLASVCTLRRFSVETNSYRKIEYDKRSEHLTKLEHFRLVIARNPNLTHLALLSDVACNLSSLFCDIPPNHPLKLEHLSLGPLFSEFKAIIPHIRSLKSFDCQVFFTPSDRWTLLSNEDIFPPIIQASKVDSDLIAYLGRHPGIVSLSFGDVEVGVCTLFYGVIAQHSNTLQSLAGMSRYLASSLSRISNETGLLQCTNLREFVLYASHEGCLWNCCPGHNMNSEAKIFPVIGRLSSELTVVIANNKQIFSKCVAYCDTSDNPLVRDLKGRIVYERRPPISPYR
ncbi:hypothetical protein M378DRAFT_160131 [Amanita muscaria Koide BX008]|uniref:Uncharacterized protein n=1 Tax=Amanita muscaria (strain Koide BX008) TaxID=946122 RepID=A0A0C2XCL0_AMAMK|nr:hypothetical protein M378DRAFT_160131 [Amanita muscaria Koide BX008]